MGRNATLLLFAVLITLSSGAVYCEDKASSSQPSLSLAKPSEPGKPYTSVIIDATGIGLERCMSPKIRRENDAEVWGTVKADANYVEEHGIVVYANTIAEAKKNARCGSNPLVIQAKAMSGGAFHSDPVIANADADLLLAENKISKFLDKYNVIFVKDGKL